jgi:2-hydroxychromene-2-carboxylate isomerase
MLSALVERGADIAGIPVAARLAAELGLGPAMLGAAATDQRWKDALHARTDEAIERRIFGSSFVIIDGEGFWGNG